jgi:PPOX class probable F420-dependent enzyme
VGARRDVSMTDAEIAGFVRKAKVAILSTNGPDGYPHAAGMWFVVAGDSLQMWTYAKSQKARNLVRDNRCSVVIEEGIAYHELKGVLVRGNAQIVSEFEDVARIGRALYERYVAPQAGISYEAGPSDVVEQQARKRLGVVLPMNDIVSWDHGKLEGAGGFRG